MIATAEIKAAVIAAHGRESATVLAERYAPTRNQVIGIWHRRPRDTPEELARVAALAAAAEAAAQTPFAPETAPITGNAGVAWHRILRAGPDGATAEAIATAVYPDGGRPASWITVLHECFRRLRHMAEPNGFEVALVAGSRPSRWHIQRTGVDAAAAASDGEAPPDGAAAMSSEPSPMVAPDVARPVRVPVPASIEAAVLRVEPEVPVGFTGAAGAVASLRRGCCKWPLGEPNSDAFRFCGEAVSDEGRPYCPEHRREATAGLWSARRAA